MAARKHITVAQIAAALRAEAAIISLVADRLGVSRQNIRQRIEASPELQAVVEDVDGRVTDMCKGAVIRLIQGEDGRKPDGPTVRWYLERKDPSFANRSRNEYEFSDEIVAAFVESIVIAVDGDLDKLRAARALIAADNAGEYHRR